jgi:hypothetical protein
MKSNRTKRIGMNIFYEWIQEQLLNKFYNITQQDTETLEDLDDFGKMTSETEQAMIVCVEVDAAAAHDDDVKLVKDFWHTLYFSF